LNDIAGLSFFGKDLESQKQVEYFLDLARFELVKKDTLPAQIKNLNEHLATRTFLVGHDLTISDIAVWQAIQENKRWPTLKNVSKDAPHLMRWFNYLQVAPELKGHLSSLIEEQEKKKQEIKAKGQSGGSFDINLPGASMGQVCTRFPPEPSGYLHIGHVKAALLNDYFARTYQGKLVLRFDDTNPTKEKEEFVENIYKDLETLGVKYHVVTHTSDSFELILKECTRMIKEGKAYVDNTPLEQMRAERGEGVASKCRSHTVEENLRLWQAMQDFTEEGQKCCVRAKIDIAHNNKCMRDPVMYRCNEAAHHRTGTKYKVYPTYDFACPIVDSLEGVTHALRSSEYHDRAEQYYWFIDALGVRKVHIWDFSRLNFVYTLLSKRKLQWFVDQGKVEGWFDPRFPTVQGILRRGMTVQALREFILMQGASKATNLMNWDKIWALNRSIIDPTAARYTAIGQDNSVEFHLNDQKETSVFTVPKHPKNKELGTKPLIKSGVVLLEQDDASRMTEGEEITLMNWGNAIVEKIVKDANGKVVRLEGKTNLQGDVSKTDKKVTWLATGPALAADLVPISIVEFDHLITTEKLDEGADFTAVLREQTRFETAALGEPNLRALNKGDIVQLNRRGFAIVDRIYQDSNKPLVMFMIPDGKEKSMSALSTKVAKSVGKKA